MQDGENNWMNIADIMSALMMIFMFISIFKPQKEKNLRY